MTPTPTARPQGLRSTHTPELSPEAKTFNWLLDSFTSNTAGVVEAIAVSSDGLLMAMSAIKDRANAERLAAVVSGMTSLAGGRGQLVLPRRAQPGHRRHDRRVPAGHVDQQRLGARRDRQPRTPTSAPSRTR